MSDFIARLDHIAKTSRKKSPKVDNIGKFEVKKRIQYENEVIKCVTKLKAIPLSYGDRFIPRRYFRKQISTMSSNGLQRVDENENDIFTVKNLPNYWRLHNYRINVGMQLGLSENARLLHFHDSTTQLNDYQMPNMNSTKIEYQVPSKSPEELDWSCLPRAKPLSYNDSTHDMVKK